MSQQSHLLPAFGLREIAWVLAGVLALLATQVQAQQQSGGAPRAKQMSADDAAGVQLSVDLNKPVRGGSVSVGISGRQMSVKEVWRTRDDRTVKYDVAQAYAQYYCGSANVLATEGEWKPGLGTRSGYFTYDDTVRFSCLRETGILRGLAPAGVKWSKYGAAAWLMPYSPGSETVRAEVRFGTLRPSEATALVQLALYHAGVTFRTANCKSSSLPVARYIETTVSEASSQSDIVLSAAFACE